MGSESKKIILSKNLQIQMINFFMKTSIPRAMKEKDKSSIKNLK